MATSSQMARTRVWTLSLEKSRYAGKGGDLAAINYSAPKLILFCMIFSIVHLGLKNSETKFRELQSLKSPILSEKRVAKITNAFLLHPSCSK
jgi:hypothetical protein